MAIQPKYQLNNLLRMRVAKYNDSHTYKKGDPIKRSPFCYFKSQKLFRLNFFPDS